MSHPIHKYFYGLFNDAVSIWATGRRMVGWQKNYEMEGNGSGTIQALSRHFLGGTDEEHYQLQLG
jgi:hypothetical protein